jgi:hypothetical protein
MVFPGAVTAGGARIFSAQSSLTEDDATADQVRVPRRWRTSRPGARPSGTVVAGENNWSTEVFGVDVDWRSSVSWNVATGTFFTDSE